MSAELFYMGHHSSCKLDPNNYLTLMDTALTSCFNYLCSQMKMLMLLYFQRVLVNKTCIISSPLKVVLRTGTKYYNQTAWKNPLQPKLLMVLPSVGLISGEQFGKVIMY
jgi:hypothetical protein